MSSIVVVEDDSRDLELTLGVLERSTPICAVTVARDGVEAIALFAAKSLPAVPSLLLLDLKLPRVSGFEVLSELRAAGNHLPIVVFSGSVLDEDIMRTYELGANAYVTKPTAFRDYARAIDGITSFWLNCNRPPPVHRA